MRLRLHRLRFAQRHAAAAVGRAPPPPPPPPLSAAAAQAVRKDGQMDLSAVSDKELRTLYCLIDVDRDGLISETDFITFLGVCTYSCSTVVCVR